MDLEWEKKNESETIEKRRAFCRTLTLTGVRRGESTAACDEADTGEEVGEPIPASGVENDTDFSVGVENLSAGVENEANFSAVDGGDSTTVLKGVVLLGMATTVLDEDGVAVQTGSFQDVCSPRMSEIHTHTYTHKYMYGDTHTHTYTHQHRNSRRQRIKPNARRQASSVLLVDNIHTYTS